MPLADNGIIMNNQMLVGFFSLKLSTDRLNCVVQFYEFPKVKFSHGLEL